MECGHEWRDSESVEGVTCPHCQKRLLIEDTKKRSFNTIEYVSFITTCKGYQVIRMVYFEVKLKVGEKPYYFFKEVFQRWIAPNGKTVTIALLRAIFTMYIDRWNWGSDMEIRGNHRVYDIQPNYTYPRVKVIPELLRNGFNGEYHDIAPFDLFKAILSSNRMETLLKTGQHKLLKHFIYHAKDIEGYWKSICIANRNGYIVDDATIWCDQINLLRHFGKDICSPKYVCPDNLFDEHDMYVARRQRERERERLEQKKRRAIENEQQFRELKAKFFGIEFSDGVINVRVLDSVMDFAEEGTAMKHCVFANDYYLKEDSLIFSATINGKRIETIEVSLKTLKVIQSRGVCNQNTEYHDQKIGRASCRERVLRLV